MTGTHDTVTIAVCTYRRAELSDTLASLAAQVVPDELCFAVIVIDNDATPSAQDSVAAFASTTPIELQYLHCPAGNISIARNGALEATSSRFLAFIDDDEIAEPGWLAALMDTQRTTAADVVLGPVRAIYDPKAPAWMREADTHSTAPVHVGGTIRTGYSCNVLIDLKSPALAGLRFDLALGRSGGEDTAFFTQAYRQGARFALAAPALVQEKVPPDRAKLSWLAKRRFRSGQTHGRLLRETLGVGGRLRALVLASLKVAYCSGAAGLHVTHAARRNGAVLRGILHLGTMAGLIGARPITLYGTPANGLSQ
ncbi:MAG: glycosyltransferase family 2 protein [Pseudomonadota bacterium]